MFSKSNNSLKHKVLLLSLLAVFNQVTEAKSKDILRDFINHQFKPTSEYSKSEQSAYEYGVSVTHSRASIKTDFNQSAIEPIVVANNQKTKPVVTNEIKVDDKQPENKIASNIKSEQEVKADNEKTSNSLSAVVVDVDKKDNPSLAETYAPNKPEKNEETTAKVQYSTQQSSSSLPVVLQKTLTDYPSLYEAWANKQAAQSRAKGSFALHYPTVTVQGDQVLSQHSDNYKEKNKRFEPTVSANLNIFSWGAINNQVKRDKEKERYFYYKFYETREALGNEVATEYINALFYRDSLRVLRDSLERHNKILGDLTIIVENDRGRRSEWVQGRAREVQVRQSIATYESNLRTSLSRLEKYTGSHVDVDRLVDPFPVDEQGKIVSAQKNYMKHPTYMAQQAELQSVKAELKSSKGRLLPEVNLKAAANRDDRQVYLNLSWDILNRSTSHEVSAYAQELAAAEARLTQVVKDLDERARTAKMQMEQSRERVLISGEQIDSTREVVHSYELQFKIARKTLIELLNAYSELANVELASVNAHNDFRLAALSYLYANGGIANWANVPINQERDKQYLKETADDVSSVKSH